MKVCVSQTVFACVQTITNRELDADMDSGGWPGEARNRAIDILRKGGTLLIAGDQHLPTLIQYGVNKFRDAGWAFCTLAITVGYQRRFFPDTLGLEITNPPDHKLPNTGEYTDPFGHPTYVYAVGNPPDDTRSVNRYERAQLCSSGFGIIRFNQKTNTVMTEAYQFLPDPDNENSLPDQFPGWPKEIQLVN